MNIISNIFKDIRFGIQYSKKMFAVLWRNDKTFIIYLVMDILVSSFIPFINMFLVKFSIDMLTAGGDYLNYIEIILVFIGSSIIFTNLQSFLNYKRDICGNLIGNKMYKSFFEKTMNLDYEMLLDINIMEKRELALKVINDMRVTSFTQVFKVIVTNLIVITGLVAVLTRIDIWIVLIAFGIILINTISTSLQKKAEIKINNDFIPINRKMAYFFNTGSDSSNIKEIRIYSMIKPLLSLYSDLQNVTLKLVRKSFRLFLNNRTVSNLSTALLDLVAYILLGFKVLVTKAITVGDFSLYLSTIRTFNFSVQGILTSYLDMINNGQYIKDYFEFMEIETMMEDQKDDIPINQSMSFTFENVSYKYPHQENYSLQNLNLIINTNEKLAIVGENGAGKTTLIMLLMRMINPTKGRILLNGIDIKKFPSEEYFKLFSTVFQDYKLFAFQIKDNISSLDDSDVTSVEEKVNFTIDKVGLRTKINSLENGIHTYIDKIYENDGVFFSGGESQRIAIAKALYKSAPVVILDEPTASLDARVEYEIYTKFREITANKTTIYITHRLSSTRICDRVIVLKEGCLIDSGSHIELLGKCSYYKELYNMQAQFFSNVNFADESFGSEENEKN